MLRRGDSPGTGHESGSLIQDLERAIEVDPLAEPLYQRLISLLTAQGRRADAIGVYHRCRTSLARWADQEPCVEMQRLFQQFQSR